MATALNLDLEDALMRKWVSQLRVILKRRDVNLDIACTVFVRRIRPHIVENVGEPDYQTVLDMTETNQRLMAEFIGWYMRETLI